jgi:hypothetical protein
MITNIVSIQTNIQTMLDIIKLIARQIKKLIAIGIPRNV